MSEEVGSIDAAIVAGINERVNASVLAALSSDDLFSTLITSALQQPVRKPGSSYRDETEPYIQSVLREAISQSVRDAVQTVVAEETEHIADEVRKSIKRNAAPLADALVASLKGVTESSYRMNVELVLPGSG